MRKIIFVLATALLLLAVSQLAFTNWWLDRWQDVVYSSSYRWFGLIGIIFGLPLLIASAGRMIGLRVWMAVIGLLTVTGGLVILLNPDLGRDLSDTAMLNRSRSFQVFMMWASGIVRMLIAASIFYALAKRPVTAGAEQPPSPPTSPPLAA